MEQEKFSARRNYSAQFRTLVLEQCAAPGASVAKVALSHGMNANVVHRWRQEAPDSASSLGVREFVPVAVPAPSLRIRHSQITCKPDTTREAWFANLDFTGLDSGLSQFASLLLGIKPASNAPKRKASAIRAGRIKSSPWVAL